MLTLQCMTEEYCILRVDGKLTWSLFILPSTIQR